MSTPTVPKQRKGVVKTLTMDFDAVELLRDLVPSTKSVGRYLSELVRNEQLRREERARVRLALEHVWQDEPPRVAQPPSAVSEAGRACE